MPDLSDAQREAYARANSSSSEKWSLEFRHSTFPDHLRIFQYTRNVDLPIEVGAPVNGGTNQEFIGLGFQFVPPTEGTDARTKISARIDGVPGTLLPFIRGALLTDEPIECAMRLYLFDVLAPIGGQVVEHQTTLHLQVLNASSTALVTNVAFGYTNSSNQSVPSELYTTATNPSLQ